MDSRLLMDMKQRRFAHADVFRHGHGATAKNEWACSAFLNDGRWLMTWSQGTGPGYPDERVVGALSNDMGRTWSPPFTVVASKPEQELHVPGGVPFVVPGSGRIYVFFLWVVNTDAKSWLRNPGLPLDGAGRRYPEHDSGHLSFVYSDDDGGTWSDRQLILLPHREICTLTDRIHGWLATPPQVMPTGEVVFTFTGCKADLGLDYDQGIDWPLRPSETNLIRCDNLLTETDPEDLEFTLLPYGTKGIRLDVKPYQGMESLRRFHSVFYGEPLVHGSSFEDTSVVTLTDGRWACVGRTKLGCPCFSVSADQGATWSKPEPLRRSPEGPYIPHPMALCPMTKTSDGRFVLLFCNNNGMQRGGSHIWDTGKVRNPQWIAVGCDTGSTRNLGLWFGDPFILAEAAEGRSMQDTVAPEISMPQFIERNGRYFVSYSVKKRDILVDEIPAAVLDGITPKW